MLITLVNAISVIIGTSIGLLMKRAISSAFRDVIMLSAGIITLVIGFQMISDDASMIALLFSLIFGGLIGYGLKIEDRIVSLGDKFSFLSRKDGSVGLAFLNSSLLFCSGAMSIVGSIDLGTTGDGSLILIKSIMDGFMAIVFAATYGPGVYLSAIVIIIYQGFWVYAGSYLEPIIGSASIESIASLGGCLLIMIAISLIGLKNIKTANFIPALVLAPLFSFIFELLAI